jgi:hypothetical protein
MAQSGRNFFKRAFERIVGDKLLKIVAISAKGGRKCD